MADQVNLRPPVALMKRLEKDAAKEDCTVQAVALKILSEHYEIPVTVPARGRPKKDAR